MWAAAKVKTKVRFDLKSNSLNISCNLITNSSLQAALKAQSLLKITSSFFSQTSTLARATLMATNQFATLHVQLQ